MKTRRLKPGIDVSGDSVYLDMPRVRTSCDDYGAFNDYYKVDRYLNLRFIVAKKGFMLSSHLF